jgi:hypothetical protein
MFSMNESVLFRRESEMASDRKEFPGASVDLVYRDTQFDSNADHGVLFREPSG